MSIWSADQNLNVPDESAQRQGFGTVGGDHVVNGSLSNRKASSVVDPLDTRISYGAFQANGLLVRTDTNDALSFTSRGTNAVLGGTVGTGTPGAAGAYRFTGTSIGVLASTNPFSGVIQVFIDGVPTPGKLPVNVGLRMASNPGPAVLAGDTVVNILGSTSAFPSSGRILIGGELIDYTGTLTQSFTGCTRGAGGTLPADHTGADSVSLWDYQVDLSTTSDYATRRLVYYNPLLQPGDHQIVIVVQPSIYSGYARIYFEGFVQGQLLGAGNIFTQIATITLPVTTSANGHYDLGVLATFNPDVVIIGVLGITQPNAAGDNTVALGQLGIKYDQNTLPFLYLHTAQPSSTFNVTISFSYLGESQ
jgi:hypothetical protein